jgi:putative transposase
MPPPTRKQLRLLSHPYRGQGWFFITICTHARVPYFERPKLAAWIETRLSAAAQEQMFRLHAWCIMPDHVHIFTEGATPESDLRQFVTRFKQQTSFTFAKRFGNQLWQKNFYDHVVRPYEPIHPIFWYIWMNPVRKGLCADPREYQFSGSETIEWKQNKPAAQKWTPPWKAAKKNEAPPP